MGPFETLVEELFETKRPNFNPVFWLNARDIISGKVSATSQEISDTIDDTVQHRENIIKWMAPILSKAGLEPGHIENSGYAGVGSVYGYFWLAADHDRELPHFKVRVSDHSGRDGRSVNVSIFDWNTEKEIRNKLYSGLRDYLSDLKTLWNDPDEVVIYRNLNPSKVK